MKCDDCQKYAKAYQYKKTKLKLCIDCAAKRSAPVKVVQRKIKSCDWTNNGLRFSYK